VKPSKEDIRYLKKERKKSMAISLLQMRNFKRRINMPKDFTSIIYSRLVWTTKPTRYDKVGCDGLYVKKVEIIKDPEITAKMEAIYATRS
jgi:hypothetical protein